MGRSVAGSDGSAALSLRQRQQLGRGASGARVTRPVCCRQGNAAGPLGRRADGRQSVPVRLDEWGPFLAAADLDRVAAVGPSGNAATDPLHPFETGRS